MDVLIVFGIAIALATWTYRAGKQFGSQKGYVAGRRGRFHRHRH